MRIFGLVATVTLMESTASGADLQQEYPYSRAAVYDALIQVLPANGYRLLKSDSATSRVVASQPLSAFSFGENLSIEVLDAGPDRSSLELGGSLKLITSVSASGRLRKHFDKIVTAVSQRLQEQPPLPTKGTPPH